MSLLSDIMTAAKQAIAANSTLSSANVFKREELKADHTVSAIDVFMKPLTVTAIEPGIIADARSYRIQFVLVFDVDGRSNSTTATDTVTVNKGTYFDALADALRTLFPGGSNPVANIYHCAFTDGDLNYQEGPGYEEVGPTVYRISQTWEFFVTTYDSPILTQAGRPLVAG